MLFPNPANAIALNTCSEEDGSSDDGGKKDRERGYLSKKSKKMLYEVGYSEFAKARDDDRQSPRSSPELWDWVMLHFS